MKEERRERLRSWLDRLEAMFLPLVGVADRTSAVVDLVRAHVAVAEALAATDTIPGTARVWAQDAGEALADRPGVQVRRTAGTGRFQSSANRSSSDRVSFLRTSPGRPLGRRDAHLRREKWRPRDGAGSKRPPCPARPARMRSNASRDLPEPERPRISTARSPTSTAEA